MAVAAYSSSSKADREQIGQARPATAVVCLFILDSLLQEVQQDSFQSLRIQIDQGHSEPFGFSLGSPSPLGDSLSSLDRDCSVGSGRSLTVRSQNQTQLRSPVSPPAQQTSRYKTEMCRPFQENGTCKYGEKCQFAHGSQEVRNINRHPKYKTDLCLQCFLIGLSKVCWLGRISLSLHQQELHLDLHLPDRPGLCTRWLSHSLPGV